MAYFSRGWRRFARTFRIAALGVRAIDRVRITGLMLGAPLRRRVRAARGLVELRVRLPSGPCAWHADGDGDLYVLEDIVHGEYDVPGLEDVKTVLDLGGHVGASVAFFRQRFPEARIIAVEPDPANFRKLELNVGGLRNVELHQFAVTPSSGPVTFYSSGAYDSWTSSVRRKEAFQKKVTVEGRTLDSVLESLALERVDLLKIDIEGSEFEVLPTFRGIERVRAVVGEIHPYDNRGIDDIREALAGFRTDLPERASGHTNFRAVREGDQTAVAAPSRL